MFSAKRIILVADLGIKKKKRLRVAVLGDQARGGGGLDQCVGRESVEKSVLILNISGHSSKDLQTH